MTKNPTTGIGIAGGAKDVTIENVHVEGYDQFALTTGPVDELKIVDSSLTRPKQNTKVGKRRRYVPGFTFPIKRKKRRRD